MNEDAIAAIRTRAELARRLAAETIDPAAKSALLQIASLLEADADGIQAAAQASCSSSAGAT